MPGVDRSVTYLWIFLVAIAVARILKGVFDSRSR